MSLSLTGRLRHALAAAAICAAFFARSSVLAGSTATPGWTAEAAPAQSQQPPGNLALCKSLEKGALDRVEQMRFIRFGATRIPFNPQDLKEWQKQTYMDPQAASKYSDQENMVKRLNGYMIANGCAPVDIEAELKKGPTKEKLGTR